MSNSKLPERASLEYLKKLAKDRLVEFRREDPSTKLARAQLDIANEYGFSSWRELGVELARVRAPRVAQFFKACQDADVGALGELLRDDPGLVRERDEQGRTALHVAARAGELAATRLLLERGASVNVRDRGDNASPLHFAASGGKSEIVAALLDAGADVHGFGDVHQASVIGWAARPDNAEVVALLLERGARHHIFSAIAMGDLSLVQRLVEEEPERLHEKKSRFEHGQTPLHAALFSADGIRRKAPSYELAELLIELGADLEATDGKGRTVLDIALLYDDRETARRLLGAGARPRPIDTQSPAHSALVELGESVSAFAATLFVSDLPASVAFYMSIGFKLNAQHEHDGVPDYALLAFGKAGLHLSPGSPSRAALWFYTERIEELYRALKSRRLYAARAALAGKSAEEPELKFTEDLYEPFYGGKQFTVEDPDGHALLFYHR
ncbi:MAG TPA: ankyrin repeat domain-containing protein [Polyangiaceae bacterium]|jgi:ankyrin repeat protein/catechol 2,3-dioxygenase-like lactoylglutathione lyase family enzyme